jgi:hypothetical protein
MTKCAVPLSEPVSCRHNTAHKSLRLTVLFPAARHRNVLSSQFHSRGPGYKPVQTASSCWLALRSLFTGRILGKTSPGNCGGCKNKNWIYSTKSNWIYSTKSNWIYSIKSYWIYSIKSNWIYSIKSNWIYSIKSVTKTIHVLKNCVLLCC